MRRGNARVWPVVLALVGLSLAWWLLRPRPPVTPAEAPRVVAQVEPQGADSESRLAPQQAAAARGPRAGNFIVQTRSASPARAQIIVYKRGPISGAQRLPWTREDQADTGPDGRAVLAVGEGAFLVVARAEGLAPSRVQVERLSREQVTRLELTLDAGAQLVGRTLSGRDPVPLARVRLVAEVKMGAAQLTGPEEEDVTLVSDAQGNFQGAHLGLGLVRVFAEAPGMGTTRLDSEPLPRRGPLEIQLRAAAFIEGFVQDAEGKPVAGALVTALRNREPRTAETTATGSYSLEVEPGAWMLSAQREAQAAHLTSPVSSKSGATVRAPALVLGAAGVLECVVQQAGDHRPIEGAEVELSGFMLSGVLGEQRSDAQGRARFAGLAPMDYDVVVQRPGHVRELRRGVVVAAGQTVKLTFDLGDGCTVEGKVTDGHDRGLAGVLVRAGQPLSSAAGIADSTSALSDADGSYRIAGIRCGQTIVAVDDPDLDLGATGLGRCEADSPCRIDLQVREPASLSGLVHIPSLAADRRATVLVLSRTTGVSLRSVASAEVGPDGRYSVRLEPGPYIAIAQLPSGSPGGSSQPVQITLEPGARTTLDLDITLTEGQVSGRVLEPDGAPAGGATVIAVAPRGQRMREAVTDEQGQFLFTNLQAREPMVLRARRMGRTASATLPPDQSDLTLTLRPAARIVGTVHGDQPISGFELRLATETYVRGLDELAFHITGDHYELNDIPAGRVVVTLFTEPGGDQTGEVMAEPGETSALDFTVKTLPSVSGRVLLPDGRPAAGLLVECGPIEDDNDDAPAPVKAYGSFQTGADGRFHGRLAAEPEVCAVRFKDLIARATQTLRVGENDLGDLHLDRSFDAPAGP